jgi:hypothetical protein
LAGKSTTSFFDGIYFIIRKKYDKSAPVNLHNEKSHDKLILGCNKEPILCEIQSIGFLLEMYKSVKSNHGKEAKWIIYF